MVFLKKNRDSSQHDVAHNYTAEFPPLKWGLHPKPAALGTCYALNPVQASSRRPSAGVNQDRTRDHTNNKASHVTARQYISLSDLQAQKQPHIVSLRKFHWLAWSVLQVDQRKAKIRAVSTEEKETCCKTAASFDSSLKLVAH